MNEEEINAKFLKAINNEIKKYEMLHCQPCPKIIMEKIIENIKRDFLCQYIK